jgi:hypothetical protein
MALSARMKFQTCHECMTNWAYWFNVTIHPLIVANCHLILFRRVNARGRGR